MLKLKVNETVYTFPSVNTLNLLDIATSVKDLKVGCKKGICGICVVKVEEGMNNVSERTDIESSTLETIDKLGSEFRLLCQCKINGDVSLCNTL